MSKDRKKKLDYAMLPIVNQQACGIDLGGKFHVVSIGQNKDRDVRRFGVYTQDLYELLAWLQEHDITSVCMEATGVYWKPLWRILQSNAIEVVLVNGQHWKKEKKTDVLDAMWLQQLHSLGLLKGSYLVDEHTECLKNYWRHRQKLLSQTQDYTRRIQKCMRQMNICLEVVLSDIMGATGRSIIEKILAGQRDAELLIGKVHNRIKKSKAEILKALQADWREDQLFALAHYYDLYQQLWVKIEECDQRIDQVLSQRIVQIEASQEVEQTRKEMKKKQRSKNAPKIKIQDYALSLFEGIDLSAIPGVGHNFLLHFLAEVGTTVEAFPRAANFVAWLRLAPKNKISGGKTLSSRAPKTNQTITQAFKHCANAIGRANAGALSSFFKRIAAKKGWNAAVTATARKLAVIVWNMLKHKAQFQYHGTQDYEQVQRNNKIKKINQQLRRLNIKPEELSFALD